MWLTTIVAVCLLTCGSWAKPTQTREVSLTCKDIFSQQGFDMEEFALASAHGIHSLYLEDIRHFFEPDAPENNGIPVLNFNISAPDRIWPNSPLVGLDSSLLR